MKIQGVYLLLPIPKLKGKPPFANPKGMHNWLSNIQDFCKHYAEGHVAENHANSCKSLKANSECTGPPEPVQHWRENVLHKKLKNSLLEKTTAWIYLSPP